VFRCTFWHTTMGFFLCYNLFSSCTNLIPSSPRPWRCSSGPYLELGKIEVKVATSTDEHVNVVAITASTSCVATPNAASLGP
jgi:hypothetical protein